MRASVFLILFALLFHPSKDENDWSKLGLKGKVRSLYESVELKMDPPLESGLDKYSAELIFNEKGYRIKYSMFSFQSHDSAIVVSNTNFDDRDNKTSETSFNGRGNNKTVETRRYRYEYDDYNRVVKKIVESDSTIADLGIEVYKYDSSNRVKEVDRFNLDGKGNGKSIFIYSGKNLKTENELDNAGNLFRTTIYADVNDKNIKQQDVFNGDGVVTWKMDIVYDSHNNLIMAIDSGGDELTRQTCAYNFHGDRTKMNTTYEHKNLPNIVAHERYKYEYDSHENWIKKTAFVNNAKTQIITRTILYY